MMLIVSGGEVPASDTLVRLAEESDLVIAADIGAKYCIDADIIPDVVLGDMDSIPGDVLDSVRDRGAEIISYSHDKDETDTQLALDLAIAKGAKEIRILSGIGDRFDHSIANLHLLYRALKHGVNASIIAKRHIIFLVYSQHEIKGMKGKTISFMPLTERVEGIRLKGFAYNLSSGKMELGFPYGVSNIVNSDRAIAEVGKGVLIAIILE